MKTSDDQALHEWRKQPRYLLNELELVAAVFGPDQKKLRRHAEKLADILGDDHDLSVLARKIRTYEAGRPRLMRYIKKRRHMLQRSAARQGKKLYRHSNKHMRATLAAQMT